MLKDTPGKKLIIHTHYNHIAAESLERLAALSDGIFAVAMTLLVLDLRVPVVKVLTAEQPLWVSGALTTEQPLWDALTRLWPSLLTYLMSFLTLGIFWVSQQTQLNHIARSNRHYTWLHLVYLLAVSLTPFSTALLAQYIMYRIALVIYWLNILVLGTVLYCGLHYARHAKLEKETMTIENRYAHERRFFIAQSLYAFGALLCIFNTYISIGFIILVQLNYAIAPRIPLLELL